MASAQQAHHPPLLATKLHVPRHQGRLVLRASLLQRLEAGLRSRVIAVTAPPGFGKTTLLTEWLTSAASAHPRVVWVSLDSSDNDYKTFWTYATSAIEGCEATVAAPTLARLESPEVPETELLLPELVNSLSSSTEQWVLVLDDYHAITNPEIHASVSFFIEHAPSNVHVVISSRSDPPFPVARLRARGELTEIRAADLRFSADEAASYFHDVMGIPLAPADVAALEERTEGWIAALQLAGLSMQGRDDLAAFVAGFAGDDRFIVDYLVEEVLQRLPEVTRTFLLQTSVLDRMTAPLCDALTGQENSSEVLEDLERRNLFLIPLDDRRQWYRYHHLFADLLRARFRAELPDQIPILHARASAWLEHDGQRPEAIEHALAAGDHDRAAALVELELPSLRQTRQDSVRRRWLEALPNDVLATHPVLSNESAGDLLQRGETNGVEQRLRDAERWLGTKTTAATPQTGTAGPFFADPQAFERLPAHVALHRAGQSLLTVDLEAAASHAKRVLELASETDDLTRGGAAAILALARWSLGDLNGAAALYPQAIDRLVKAGHISDAAGCILGLADIQRARGDLRGALQTIQRGLRLLAPTGLLPRRGAADMHVALAEIHLERNELSVAADQLRSADALGEAFGMPQYPHRSRVAAARLKEAEGDFEAAQRLLAEAEERYFGDFSPDVQPVHAVQARVAIAEGKLIEAVDWARAHELEATDDVDYTSEFEHATLARLLLAEAQTGRDPNAAAQAVHLLERLLGDAREGGRTGSAIETLVLLALVLQARKETQRALDALEQALSLAEPQGYVRTFTEEGAHIAPLLEAIARQGGEYSRYASSLLAALRPSELSRHPGATSGMEALSDRELDVLRLLATDLDGPEIASELVVSLNTLRTHTRSIYGKLGVNSRRAAVTKAHDLRLLP